MTLESQGPAFFLKPPKLEILVSGVTEGASFILLVFRSPGSPGSGEVGSPRIWVGGSGSTRTHEFQERWDLQGDGGRSFIHSVGTCPGPLESAWSLGAGCWWRWRRSLLITLVPAGAGGIRSSRGSSSPEDKAVRGMHEPFLLKPPTSLTRFYETFEIALNSPLGVYAKFIAARKQH